MQARPEVRADEVFRMPVDVSLDEALIWFEREGRRFTDLVRRIDEPDRRTAGLTWTLAESAVHVLDVMRRYREGVLGNLTPHVPRVANFPAYAAVRNEEAIRAEPERRPAVLADMIDDARAELAKTAEEVGPGAVVTLDAGHSETIETMLCGHIGEFLVHGHDIAKTIGMPWLVEGRSAVLAVHATSAALELALDPLAAEGVEMNVHVRLRGGEPFAIRVSGGRVWSERPAGKPDFTLSVDPGAYLLTGFGRLTIVQATMRRQAFGWGRKPWLLLKLPKLFLKP